MDEIQQFLREAYDSSRWYHERSQEQRAFDNAVTANLGREKRIEAAVKEAVRQMPDMKVFLAGKTMPELTEYYERLHQLELEIALADNTRQLVAIRKRKARQ